MKDTALGEHLVTNIRIMNYVSHRKEALVLLPQPNYFNFWAKKLAHQRCAKSHQQHDLAVHAKQ